MAGPGWITRPRHVPLRQLEQRHRWLSTGVFRDLAKSRRPATGLDPKRPDHTIVLSTELYHGPRQAYGFSLLATWEPEHGWGRFVNFRSYDGPVGLAESFSLTLSHPALLPKARGGKPASAIVLGSGQGPIRHGAERRSISLPRFRLQQAPRRRRATSSPQIDPIRRYWSSAASFQEAALEELHRLEENARVEIASGRAFTIRTKGGPTGRDVRCRCPALTSLRPSRSTCLRKRGGDRSAPQLIQALSGHACGRSRRLPGIA